MNDFVCLSPNGVDRYSLAGPPRDVLVGTMDGVVRLQADADGAGWTVVDRMLAGHHVSAMMQEPGRGALFVATHGQGLFRSLDGGSTWGAVLQDRVPQQVFTLAFDRRGDDVALYAGCEPARLYRSIDGGDGWEELVALRDVPSRERWSFPPPPHIAHVKHVAVDPRDPQIFYVCIEQGALLKTTDGGLTFEQLLFEDDSCRYNSDAHRVVFHPRDPDLIYLDGGDGIFRSVDAGRSWEHLATPAMRLAYPDQLFIDPEQPETLFAVGGGTPPNVWRATGDAQSTVVRSRDGGRGWSQLGGGLPAALPGNLEAASMVVWPGGYGFFAGSTDGEVFLSLDRGESWSAIATGLPPVSKCVHHANLAKGRAIAAAATN